MRDVINLNSHTSSPRPHLSDEFENGSFTLKRIKCFRSTLRRGNLKNNNPGHFRCECEEMWSGKAPFQNVFRPHKTKKESVLKILEVSFRKTPFS